MNPLNPVSDVLRRFKSKEVSIRSKLKALEKQLMSSDYIISCCEPKRITQTNKSTEILERDNAASRNVAFMKELNIAETQLRIMACFCPTENYLQSCKSKFVRLY